MARRKAEPAPRPSKIRCAVYTRKSSEEGLEQEFNSLDAQREACLAYIASQRHEGWTPLPDHYDDGGFSGGTMERPALQRLLAEIAAGRVDVVVVYKVDRLTRALGDFARIVELFDRHRVSFVSVTQAFNTTTSMGRLTLNVLLSFAQFEREVTGERIRDKIAASKKKGMWMGGQPPLGYDVQDRKLVVNEAEAELVRFIYRRYLALRSVRELKVELDAAGIRSKARRAADGSAYGSQPFSRGALYLMLQNRMYRGEITHKGTSYPGEHQAIIDEQLWSEVRAALTENRVDRAASNSASAPSLLTGFVYGGDGERLTPTHANKRGVRYRYYVSRSLQAGTAPAGTGQRIPAEHLEALVRNRLCELLLDPVAILQPLKLGASRQHAVSAAAKRLASELLEADPPALRQLVVTVITRVQVHLDRIDLAVAPDRLLAWIENRQDLPEPDPNTPSITLTIPAALKRVGMEMRFIVDGVEERPADPGLVRLLQQAHALRDRVLANHELTIEEAGRQESIGPSYASRLIRLAFIAPSIVSDIMAGRQPPELTATSLLSDTRLSLDWAEQRRALGFAG